MKTVFPTDRGDQGDPLDEMREFMVDVRAGEKTWTIRVEGADGDEAIQRAARRLGIALTAKEV